jgi:hypothetical protein
MAEREALTAAYLRSILHYNPETGVFTWRIDFGRWGQLKAGTRADYPARSNGVYRYNRINIGRHRIYAHLAAWIYMTGEWPKLQIDHRDTNKTNNRWLNLREASPSENGCNVSLKTNNKSGEKNVSWSNTYNKWEVILYKDKKRIYAGRYADINVARSVAREKRAKLHGAFAKH